ncbi:hypothetical protein C7450_12117 [Chelatococcus asaccharovorans]|uniref:Uncharacterized protein n=1 Tax=Chelatococcus asaccharovorans TaxID=28210 RepID=A0A2V3TT01_9HYPH|nr:hypothetical protein C7450_12117 [Chelatococcus asaccharovorans]
MGVVSGCCRYRSSFNPASTSTSVDFGRGPSGHGSIRCANRTRCAVSAHSGHDPLAVPATAPGGAVGYLSDGLLSHRLSGVIARPPEGRPAAAAQASGSGFGLAREIPHLGPHAVLPTDRRAFRECGVGVAGNDMQRRRQTAVAGQDGGSALDRLGTSRGSTFHPGNGKIAPGTARTGGGPIPLGLMASWSIPGSSTINP